MRKHLVLAAALALLLGGAFIGDAKAQFYPLLDKMADKVVAAYKNAPCEKLTAPLQLPADPDISPGAMKAMVAEMKHNDSEREEFINRVAPAIANKLLDCGLIP